MNIQIFKTKKVILKMKATTKIFMLALILSLMLAVSAAAAADNNSFEKSDLKITTEDTSQNLLTFGNNIKINEENKLTQSNDKIVGKQNNQNVLSEDEGNYSDLRKEIESGEDNIILNKKYYRYVTGDGDTIEISKSCTIDGNGAVIDMSGFNARVFYASVSQVTIKNLTIKNSNYDGKGTAILFDGDAVVVDCNFINNNASGNEACAVYFSDYGSVIDCNFINNTGYDGAAVYFELWGNVTNCNFINNFCNNGGTVFFM